MTPTPLDDLTPRQRDVLLWIAEHVRRFGCGPTYREGQAAFGMKSPHGFRTHVLALVRKGLVEADAKLSRGMRLAAGIDIEEPVVCAAGHNAEHGGPSDGVTQRRSRPRRQ